MKELKSDLAKKLVELKFVWWCIADDKEHDTEKKQELFKIAKRMNKSDLIKNIECYKSRIENAKRILLTM